MDVLPRRLLPLIAVFVAGSACADGSLGIQPVSDQHDALTAAIVSLDAEHQRQRADCQRRFLVNHCLDQVDSRYRQQHDALQSKLQALDLAQRQQRAAEQLRSIAERERQVRGNAAQPPADAASDDARRRERLRQRLREHEATVADPETPEQRRRQYQLRQQRVASQPRPAPALPLPAGR